MANNQYINKIIFGDQTKIDLTGDTVTADKLLSGYTAHDKSGAPITGSYSPGPSYPLSISVDSIPTKTEYDEGDALDLTGLVVNANMADGSKQNITSQSTKTPANGEILSVSNTKVDIGYNFTVPNVPAYDVPFATSFNIIVNEKYEIPSWSSGTDAQIIEALQKHYAGEIDITKYWEVGQARRVYLSAMSATGVGESHSAQYVDYVLSSINGKTLSDGSTICAFQVDQKDCLLEVGYINPTNDNSGGWDACARRTWCNETYRNSIPSSIRPIFKQFKVLTAKGTGTAKMYSNDYFALRSEKEIHGYTDYANSSAESGLSQATLYETSANKIKKLGIRINGSATGWFTRSPVSNNNQYFCGVSNNGNMDANYASGNFGIAPFGVI